MSLDTWERQTLDSIKHGLADSDPVLAARLAIFTRLASGEDMPAWEKVHPGSRRVARRSGPEAKADPRRGRLSLSLVMVLVWLVTSIALIAVTFALNRSGSRDTCLGPWTSLCAGSASAARPVLKMPWQGWRPPAPRTDRPVEVSAR